MIRSVLHSFILTVVLSCAAAWARAEPADPPLVMHRVAGTFSDLHDRAIFAIEGKGLTVSQVAKVGEMLRRTAGDLGLGEPPYGDAEVIEFCSASLSRAVVEADPRYLAVCPYSIALYTLRADPGYVHVGYRRIPVMADGSTALKSAVARAESLIADIVRETLE